MRLRASAITHCIYGAFVRHGETCGYSDKSRWAYFSCCLFHRPHRGTFSACRHSSPQLAPACSASKHLKHIQRTFLAVARALYTLLANCCATPFPRIVSWRAALGVARRQHHAAAEPFHAAALACHALPCRTCYLVLNMLTAPLASTLHLCAARLTSRAYKLPRSLNTANCRFTFLPLLPASCRGGAKEGSNMGWPGHTCDSLGRRKGLPWELAFTCPSGRTQRPSNSCLARSLPISPILLFAFHMAPAVSLQFGIVAYVLQHRYLSVYIDGIIYLSAFRHHIVDSTTTAARAPRTARRYASAQPTCLPHWRAFWRTCDARASLHTVWPLPAGSCLFLSSSRRAFHLSLLPRHGDGAYPCSSLGVGWLLS